MPDNHCRSKREGFALLTTGACLVAMVGTLGLATDVGRVLIVKNEAQAYADAAALSAAVELDGTADGITRANTRIGASTNRWNLGTTTFSGTQVEFAIESSGAWHANPNPATGIRFVRVTAAANVPLYFLPVVGTAHFAVVNSRAVAGQLLKTSFTEGVLPFSPFSHDDSRPDFGFTPGFHYTLRWPANPRLNANLCPGDDAEPWVAQAEAGGASERGYIEETSSDIIRASIEQDYQTDPVTVGQPVQMTGGNKQTQRDSLITRINRDSDTTSTTYTEYVAGGSGNGRRLVLVPVNTGPPDHIVLGFGLFFLLLPSEYDHSGNSSFCAEFIGPYVQGSGHGGAGGAGAYVVRLVQ